MNGIYDICDFGAVGDGTTDCTEALQTAIDRCAENGGGTVLVPPGRYLFYPLRLKSGVRLEVSFGAVMLAGTDPALYPEVEPNSYWNVGYALRHNRRYVFYAEGAENVTICGGGKIDFQGESFVKVDPNLKPGEGTWKRYSDEMVPGRSLFFVGCRDIVFENLTLVNSAGWFTWFLDCDNLRISGVKMYADLRLPNTDGIHLGSCRHVVISDCDLRTGDNSIIIRSMQEQFSEPKRSENIVVTNCILNSFGAAILLGFSHDYMIKNCVFSNLVVSGGMFSDLVGIVTPSIDWSESKDPPRYPDTPRPYPEITPLIIEDVSFNNINVQIGGTLLWLEFDPVMPVDHVSGITFRGIQGRCGNWPCIRNQPNQRVSDIEFHDIRLDVITLLKQAPWRKPVEAFEFGNAENVILDGVRIRKAANVPTKIHY